jgi:ATP-dependent DNA ligase
VSVCAARYDRWLGLAFVDWPLWWYMIFPGVMPFRSPLARPAPSGFIEPCLPTLARTVPDGPRWAFEVRHDGFRFIARRDGDRVRVFSRHGKDWTDKVPAIGPYRSGRCADWVKVKNLDAPAATRVIEW